MTVARTALPAFSGPKPQYHSIIAQASTVLGQIRSLEYSDTIESTKAGRVGSSTKKTLKKSKTPTCTINVWVDDDLAEIANVLGASSAPSATETVKLDPDASAKTFYVHTYDDEDGTTHLNTIYLFEFTALTLGYSLDEDGEQVATVTGDLTDVYWIVNDTGA